MSNSLSIDSDSTYDSRNRSVLLAIHVPKDAQAVCVGILSKKPEQNEILIARDSTFKYKKFSVIKDEKHGNENLKVDGNMQVQK
ncbi:ADP-ribosyltransferase [Bacillus cereus]